MSRRARRTAGFTLVEMLVALVLAGLVVSALATLTAQWLPNWKRGLTRVENVERVSLALQRVSADIAAAEFVPATLAKPTPLFEGHPASLTFVRTTLGPNARAALEIVRLAPGTGGGLARSTGPYLPRSPEDGAPRFGAPVTLLAPPYQLEFSYAGADGQWTGDWVALDELPRAVRIVLRDGRTGQALNVSTVAQLSIDAPAGCLSGAPLPVCNGGARDKPTDANGTAPEAQQ